MMRRLAIAAVLACMLCTATVAYAATVSLYPGLGVGSARLGSLDSSAVTALKKAFALTGKGVDNNYAGQRVYYYYFGKALPHNRNEAPHYPVEMYANKSHRVFIFEVNSPTCVTGKGIRVGSTEAQLQAAYGSTLKKRTTPTYYLYSSGTARNHTDYYVGKGTRRITRVLISRY